MGGLALAGALSGMGQAAERGLNTLQAQIGAAGMAEDADKRIQAREEKAYQRRRYDIEDERRYNDELRRRLFEEGERQKDTIAQNDLKRKEEGLAKKVELEERESDLGKGLRAKKREEDTDADIRKTDKIEQANLQRREDTVEQRNRVATREFAAEKPLRTAKRDEAITDEKEKTTQLAGDDGYLKGTQKIADAKESSGQRAQAAAISHKLQQDEKLAALQDQLVAAVQSGDQPTIERAQNAYLAAAGKLMEAQKTDLASASAGMRETGTEITRLSTILKDMMPGDPAYEATKRRLLEAEAMHRAFTARVANLSGSAMPQTAQKGPVEIKDRFAPGPGGPPPAGGMVAQAQKEKTVPMPSAAEQSRMGAAVGETVPNPGPMEALKQGAAPVIEGAKEAIGNAGTAVMGAITPYGGPSKQVPAPSAGEREQMLAAVRGDEQRPGMVAQAAPPEPEAAASEGEAGRDTRVMALLRKHEGVRETPYNDGRGNRTVGIGHNLDAKPLSKNSIEAQFKDDVGDARTDAAKLKYYNTLDPVRQDAVTALVFNMGLKGVNGFKRFNAAMEAGDWQRAKQELLASEWAKQVGPQRAQTMAEMIATGRYTS